MHHPTTTVPRRNLPLLSALAIFGIVLNHAIWQVLGEIPPGQPRGYAYLPLDQIGKIAIPVFMFISGYFIAYATSGGRKPLPWKVVYARITRLFWPWGIWSVIWLTGQIAIGAHTLNLQEILLTLFNQYYFIPMLMTYYLLAPLMVALGRRSIRVLLVSAFLLQIIGVALFYLQIWGIVSGIPEWIRLAPLQYLQFAFYFPFGLAVGMSPAAFAPLLRWRAALPWLTLLAFGLAIVEGSLAFRRAAPGWQHTDSHVKVTSMLLSLGVLGCCMVYDHIPTPRIFQKSVQILSANTYGIYLSHYVIIGLMDRLLVRFLPAGFSPLIGWGYILLLTVFTLLICRWMIQFSTRYKRVHPMLFG